MDSNIKGQIFQIAEKFNQVFPGGKIYTGFLAGLLKTSKENIRRKIIELQQEGKIKRVIIRKNAAGYIIFNADYHENEKGNH